MLELESPEPVLTTLVSGRLFIGAPWRAGIPRDAFAAGAALVLLLGCGVPGGEDSPDPPIVEPALAVEDQRPLESPGPGYLSSGACGACHPGAHETWSASYHRTMTQFPTPETVEGEFDGRSLTWLGRSAKLGRTRDEFWAEIVDHLEPDAAPPQRQRIVMTTGSHAMQIYWTSSGQSRLVKRLPFVWLIGEKRWVPIETAFLRPPDLRMGEDVWNGNCIACHTTNPRPRMPEGDSRVTELGIACEACHGPGLQHVSRYPTPVERYREHLEDRPDPSIVQPARLDHERGSQVCGQCHGTRFFGPSEVAGFMDRGFTYRPGDDLEETAVLVRYPIDTEPIRQLVARDPELARRPLHAVIRQIREDNKEERQFWSDGRARTSGAEYTAMIESGCYQRGTLSCMSCHSMHKKSDDQRPLSEWADDQLDVGMDRDEACVQCHPGFRGDPEEHTHHPVESSGGRCQNCHMPHTTYGLLKAIRSHTIKSPSVQESLATGRPNACNLCHLDQSLGWAAGHLETWYGIEAPQLDAEESDLAAGVLWLLRGDAGQRALIAWSMGWEDAREASGRGWMAPLLAQLMLDPYPAVRFIAGRSIRDLPGMEELRYQFTAPEKRRRRMQKRALELWEAAGGGRADPGQGNVLLDERGGVRWDEVQRLVKRRDDRRVDLRE